MVHLLRPIRTREGAGLALAVLWSAVIPDLQGIYSVFIDSSVPLHGFSHTLPGSVVYALLSIPVFVMVFRMIEVPITARLVGRTALVLLLGILLFHIIPDMFIWSDMRPLWPLSDVSYGLESRYRDISNWMGLSFLVGSILLIVANLRNQ
jgi:membrane-bound metal-dependent hydrolase YbcI (DUF457 family)